MFIESYDKDTHGLNTTALGTLTTVCTALLIGQSKVFSGATVAIGIPRIIYK